MQDVNKLINKRRLALRDAENKANALFKEIEIKNLVRSRVTEKELNDEVYNLAYEMYGIKKYWHKRIVRAGKNTLCPYKENPPNLTIQEDDILFFDFGPVFEDWEADVGRIYVLGNDAEKLRLKADVEKCWEVGKEYFQNKKDITGAELYTYVVELAKERGYEYAQAHCGHLIGNFPHETILGEEVENYIHPGNNEKMRAPNKFGKPRDWILEVHFIKRDKEIGGFFEQLLTVD